MMKPCTCKMTARPLFDLQAAHMCVRFRPLGCRAHVRAQQVDSDPHEPSDLAEAENRPANLTESGDSREDARHTDQQANIVQQSGKLTCPQCCSANQEDP